MNVVEGWTEENAFGDELFDRDVMFVEKDIAMTFGERFQSPDQTAFPIA